MPTLAEVQLVVADLFRMVEEFDQYCNTNTEKFTNGSTSHEAEFLSNLTPADGVPFDTQELMVRAVEDFRKGLDSQYDIMRNLISTGLRTWADHADIPERTPEKILERLYRYFIDNSLWVRTRAITFGTPTAAAANVGSLVCNRLTVDENNYDIESGHLDSKVARCTKDEASGAEKHEDVFEFKGQERRRDRLIRSGSGLTKTIRALSARDSLNYIDNPSFERFSGTAASPTAITGWTADTASSLAEVQLSSANVFRDYPGAPSTHYSLCFTSTTTETGISFTQDLKARRVAATRNVPLYVQMAVMTDSATAGGSGTVEIGLGGATNGTVAVTALTSGDWEIVRLQTGTTAGGSSHNWYKTFKSATALNIEVKCDGIDVGRNIYIDDVIVSPFQEFDGTWYAISGGAAADGDYDKASIDDEFTWSDTATESIIQKWIARLYPGFYLPHNTNGASIWSDPA